MPGAKLAAQAERHAVRVSGREEAGCSPESAAAPALAGSLATTTSVDTAPASTVTSPRACRPSSSTIARTKIRSLIPSKPRGSFDQFGRDVDACRSGPQAQRARPAHAVRRASGRTRRDRMSSCSIPFDRRCNRLRWFIGRSGRRAVKHAQSADAAVPSNRESGAARCKPNANDCILFAKYQMAREGNR